MFEPVKNRISDVGVDFSDFLCRSGKSEISEFQTQNSEESKTRFFSDSNHYIYIIK